jgi:hypothetical protein
MSNVMEMTYSDVERLLPYLVNKFMNHYRVAARFREDLYSAALESFTTAYSSYAPERGTFSHWVRYKAWMGMLQELNRWRKRILAEGDPEIVPNREPRLIERVLHEVGDDARTVVRLIVARAPAKCPRTAATHKHAVTQILYDLGWTATRVVESFREIREALS